PPRHMGTRRGADPARRRAGPARWAGNRAAVIRRGLSTTRRWRRAAGAAVSHNADTRAGPTTRRHEYSREVTGMGARPRHARRHPAPAATPNRTAVSPATVDYWHLQRAKTGFPTKADTDTDGRDWWWQADIDAFYAYHLAERAAKLTAVDRVGHPRDLLTAPQAAKALGYKNHRSLPDELLHNPDQADELPSGRLRRYW